MSITVSWRSIALAAAVLFASSSLLFAQATPRQGAARGARNYNPAAETTFTGTVEQVETLAGPANGPGGLHLIVRSGNGTEDVRLGPARYIESQKFAFATGDSITVTGSKATLGGQSVVIAREIRKGDQVLTLRDSQGTPRWSGRGGRR